MKNCLTCGNALIKRAHESKRRFEKKQFCSAACSRSYMKKNKIGWWSPDNRETTEKPSFWNEEIPPSEDVSYITELEELSKYDL